MKKCIAILFTLLLAISLVTVGFASQDFKSDVVLIVGGDSGDIGGPSKPGKPCECEPGSSCCNPDENGDCSCDDGDSGCTCKSGEKPEKPGDGDNKKPCQCKPGSDCCKPDSDGNCSCDDGDEGCTCKPSTNPSNPGKPGDGDDDNKKPCQCKPGSDCCKPDSNGNCTCDDGDDGCTCKPGSNSGNPSKPGDGDDKNPSKPSKPSKPSGGGGSSKPSKPSVKPSQNPNENKDRGDKAGGYDKNDDNYYLIEGVHVNETFREEGYMYGFKKFVFGADEYLTRAQFAAIMDRVFEFDNQKVIKTFEDTRGNWAEVHINRLASNGIILGVSDTEFRPNDALTRGHVLLMLTRVLDVSEYSKVSHWDSVSAYHAKETVSRLLNSGIYDDMGSNYDINLRITRGEMVHLMNNIIYQRNVRDAETENFIIQHGAYKDLLNNPSYVYYNDCIKALNDSFVFSEVAKYA